MGSRILVRQEDGILAAQRRLRELGRIRTGWSEPYVKEGRELRRPVRSKTIVLTSAQRACLDAAAEVWGGTVERWQPQGNNPEVWRLVTDHDAIEAILPPGDPLNQAMEMWSGGGCVRRCDGQTEKITNKPCVCFAQFGADFHQQKPARGVPQVCRPTSRLAVFLDLPDLGLWRIETHSYYAMLEMAGTIDLIKAKVGPDAVIPVRLRIDPRSRLMDGKSSPYPVIVVELQGRGVVAQILSGAVDGLAIEPPAPRTAIEAQPAPPPTVDADEDLEEVAGLTGPALEVARALAAIQAALSVPTLRDVWRATDGLRGQMSAEQLKGFTDRFWERKRQIEAIDLERERAGAGPAVADVAEAVHDAATEGEPDRVATWMQIMVVAGKRGMSKDQVTAKMIAEFGKDPKDADVWALDQLLTVLKAGG